MKRKGFTLIEILAVVTIIGLIFILVIPKITNSLKNKKGDVDRTTTNLVLSATKLYVQEHSSKFDKTDGNVSCMPINQLVKKGYLEGPVKNVTDDEDITDIKSVRITYNKGFKYEIVNKHECKVYYCKSDYCDSDGNEYTKVEYLESTGDQYIDTGVIPTDNIGLEIALKINKKLFNFDNNICGYRDTKNNNSRFAIITYGSSYNYGFFYGTSNYNSGKILDSRKHNIKLDKNGFFYDNVLESSISSSIYDANDSIWLFAVNNIKFDKQYNSYRIYTCKILNNSYLIRDYVPVINKDKTPCLFDKVEKKCYYNQGSGEFLYGANESEFTSINYLESTGNQYIDTGVVSSNMTKVEINGNYTYSNGASLFGVDPYFVITSMSSTSMLAFKYNNALQSTDVNNLLQSTIQLSKDGGFVNGVKYSDWNSNSFSSNYTSLLFARKTSNGSLDEYSLAKARIYYCKIWNGDNLIRDYIPKIDIYGNPCMFDRVENECYYNQGKGEFLWG